MALVKREISVAKEVDDILALVVEVIKNRKNKDDLMALLTPFISAIQGAEQVDDELKADRKAVLETVGLRVAEIADAFLA